MATQYKRVERVRNYLLQMPPVFQSLVRNHAASAHSPPPVLLPRLFFTPAPVLPQILIFFYPAHVLPQDILSWMQD